jgi:hypothetical protein
VKILKTPKLCHFFIEISIMTKIWKSCGHSTYDGIDLEEIWALYKNTTSPEASTPSKYAVSHRSRVWKPLDLLHVKHLHQWHGKE